MSSRAGYRSGFVSSLEMPESPGNICPVTSWLSLFSDVVQSPIETRSSVSRKSIEPCLKEPDQSLIAQRAVSLARVPNGRGGGISGGNKSIWKILSSQKIFKTYLMIILCIRLVLTYVLVIISRTKVYIMHSNI